MNRKMIMIIVLMFALTWSLTAANMDIASEDNRTNSHVAIDNRSSEAVIPDVPELMEDDVIVVWPNNEYKNIYLNGRSTADTMFYCSAPGAWFSFVPGEFELVMYKMEADGIIKGINPHVYAWADTSATSQDQMEVSIWTVTYPMGSDGNPYPSTFVDGNGWAGYYWDGVDNTRPYFQTAGYLDYYGDDEEEVGPCGGEAANPAAQDLVATQVWPASPFIHATFTPTTAPAGEDNWIATIDYGSEPTFLQDEWVGIVIENQGDSVEASGFRYCEGDGLVDPWVFAKFYNQCDGTSGEGGWHIRHWILDWPMAVELTGDRGPVFHSYTMLPTTLSTEDRTVTAVITDDNPSGGAAGIASASLFYTTDTVYTEVTLTNTSGDTFTADIPGQVPGTIVTYYLSATDVGTPPNTTTVTAVTYRIFEPVEDNLFIYNSDLFASWIMGYYLMGVEDTLFATDFWAYGGGTAELFGNYNTIIEVSGGGPIFCDDTDDLSAWLDEGSKNYISAGDEWLGACFYGWDPVDIVAGEFTYDYLGLDYYYPDINYSTSGDQSGISRLITVADDDISGVLHTFLGDSLNLNYNPDYEIGADNWLDGVEPTVDASVSFYGVSGILDSLGVPTGTDTLPSATYMELASGSKTAWFGFDVLSVDAGVGAGHDYWIGIYPEGPIPQTLMWMDAIASVDDDAQVPSTFALHQNYPNPFNPVTSIDFVLPSDGNVTLTVYNLLGQQVTTLVNDFRRAGTHTITWNGRNELGRDVSTGVYLYRIDAGDFSATKKMVLLK